MRRVYLDHLASTPLADEARAAVLEVLELSGNPAGSHAEGRRLRDRLEDARSEVAEAWGCRPREAIFTASGTLSSQLAFLGAAEARRDVSPRVVLSDIEHPAVDDAAHALAARGFVVTRIPPDADGRLDPDRFVEAVGKGAAAAALMLANHETGIVQPIREIAARVEADGTPLLVDACLGPGRVPVGSEHVPASLVALSAHKAGGPRGVGVLFVKRGVKVAPLWSGGPQEERLHAGTPSVALVAGAAAALRSAIRLQSERASRYSGCLTAFLAPLAALDRWRRVGSPEHAMPGVATLEIEGVEGESAMINLDLGGIAVSTGTTCALGAALPGRALLAMGLGTRRAANTLRISCGEGVSVEDASHAGTTFAAVVTRLRRLSRQG